MVPNNSIIGTAVKDALDWLLDNFSWAFDGLADGFLVLLDLVAGAFTGAPIWLMILLFALLGTIVQSWKLGVLSLVAFSLIAYMDMWEPSMISLSIVVIASLVAAVIGIPLGVLSARNRIASGIIRPVLDFLQTMPTFVYLIPVVFFFGIGPVPGMVATIVFAVAPVVRLTELGIRQVDTEVVEAFNAFGGTPRQLLFEVQLPLAKRSIFAGVNQMIMLALSMVVIMGMVGGGGIGSIVVRAVARLDIATGTEAGLAIVLMAIYLDRVTAAFAQPGPIYRWIRDQFSATKRQQRARDKQSAIPTRPGDWTSAIRTWSAKGNR